MTLKEYEIEDASFGTRTFQWDEDLFPALPAGAKPVGPVEIATPTPQPEPVASTQEPDNILTETARGQATQADVDAAKPDEDDDTKAADKPANKAGKPAADK